MSVSDLLQCIQLSTAFGAALHYPDNVNFTIWDAKQQEVRPACRIEPSDAAGVSQVLRILIEGDGAVSTMTANTVGRIKSAAQALDIAHPYSQDKRKERTTECLLLLCLKLTL